MIPELGTSPGVGHGNSLQYSCLENPHRQRDLEGYNPWGRKELDMTERLSTAQHIVGNNHNRNDYTIVILFMYIYTHRERERDRERENTYSVSNKN